MWALWRATKSGRQARRNNTERPTWSKCLFGQFHIDHMFRLRGPFWFYLMLVALLAFFHGERNRLGYWAGGLILLGAVLCAVQETRLRRGIALSKPGWWSVAAALLALAAALMFVADGLASRNRVSLALGLVGCVISVVVISSLTVRRRGGKEKFTGREARARAILIFLLILGLSCLTAFLYLTWRIQGMEAELARFYGDVELIVQNPELASDIKRALHGRHGLYHIRQDAGVGALASVFGLFVWGVERFRRAIGKD